MNKIFRNFVRQDNRMGRIFLPFRMTAKNISSLCEGERLALIMGTD